VARGGLGRGAALSLSRSLAHSLALSFALALSLSFSLSLTLSLTLSLSLSLSLALRWTWGHGTRRTRPWGGSYVTKFTPHKALKSLAQRQVDFCFACNFQVDLGPWHAADSAVGRLVAIKARLFEAIPQPFVFFFITLKPSVE